jgi:catechol 2,3-dioxygenase-like lactoylglutathione lyase family enzyme
VTRALWIPVEVADLDAATRFYTEQLGLSVVDKWERDDDRGVVLRVAAGAFIELISPGRGYGTTLLAFEQAEESEVDGVHSRWSGESGTPARHPRGHYGFTAPGPGGVRVMVWSEP